jgi:hypothetical protein
MKDLAKVFEGVLDTPDKTVEEYVEMSSNMEADFKAIGGTTKGNLRQQDAVYYEAALYGCTEPGFRAANRGRLTEHERRVLLYTLIAGWSKWTCDAYAYPETWEDREYDKGYGVGIYYGDVEDELKDHNSYRWHMNGSNSVFEFYWNYDYRQGLDDPELQRNPKTVAYKKKISTIMKKYGLSVTPL